MKTPSLLSVPVRPHQAGLFCARQNNPFLAQRVALVATILCLASSAAPALAQTAPATINPAASTAPAAGSGRISGRVLNPANGQYLENAQVTVKGTKQTVRPNVVIILADDLGYVDIGVQGSKDIPTPNIDRLANGGVRFSAGYVCWGACAPSRAGIVTGQDPHRFGFYTQPTDDTGLPPGIQTVPRVLQQYGYVTGAIGKWHLGTTPDRHPNRMGFSEWFGFPLGAHEYFPPEFYTEEKLQHYGLSAAFLNRTSSFSILRNDQPVKVDRYLTDMFSDEAVAFIQRHKTDPFFLYLAYNAPHAPWEAPDDEIAKLSLDDMTSPSGIIPPEKRRIYAAMVTKLDEGVGRVMAALRANGLEENTLVFFLSDNGGGPNSSSGKDGRFRPNYPSDNGSLRGFKGTLWESGIRVPFFASWKGRLPAGAVYDQLVSSFDIGATALALAGGAPKDMHLDGVNILPYLTGETKDVPHERLFWKQFDRGTDRGAIREGRYKLITGEKNLTYELYDIVADPDEYKNLAAKQPALVKQLDARWRAWNAEMKPPLWTTPPFGLFPVEAPAGGLERYPIP